MLPVDGRTVLLTLTLLGCVSHISCKRRRMRDVPEQCKHEGVRISECRAAFATEVEMLKRSGRSYQQTNCTLYSKLECCMVTEYGVVGCSDKDVIHKSIANAIVEHPGYDNCPRGLCDPSAINGSVKIMRDMDENLHGREAVAAFKNKDDVTGKKVKRETEVSMEQHAPEGPRSFVEEHLKSSKHRKSKKNKKSHKKKLKQELEATKATVEGSDISASTNKEVVVETSTESEERRKSLVVVTEATVGKGQSEAAAPDVVGETNSLPTIRIEVKKKHPSLSDIGKTPKKSHRRKKHRKSKTKSTEAPLQGPVIVSEGMTVSFPLVSGDVSKEGNVSLTDTLNLTREVEQTPHFEGKELTTSLPSEKPATTGTSSARAVNEAKEYLREAGEVKPGTEWPGQKEATELKDSKLLNSSVTEGNVTIVTVAFADEKSLDLPEQKRNAEEIPVPDSNSILDDKVTTMAAATVDSADTKAYKGAAVSDENTQLYEKTTGNGTGQPGTTVPPVASKKAARDDGNLDIKVVSTEGKDNNSKVEPVGDEGQGGIKEEKPKININLKLNGEERPPGSQEKRVSSSATTEPRKADIQDSFTVSNDDGDGNIGGMLTIVPLAEQSSEVAKSDLSPPPPFTEEKTKGNSEALSKGEVTSESDVKISGYSDGVIPTGNNLRNESGFKVTLLPAGVVETGVTNPGLLPAAVKSTKKSPREILPMGAEKPGAEVNAEATAKDVPAGESRTTNATFIEEKPTSEVPTPGISILVNKLDRVSVAGENVLPSTGNRTLDAAINDAKPGVAKVSAGLPGRKPAVLDIKRPVDIGNDGPLIQVKGHKKGSVEKQVVHSYESEDTRENNKLRTSLVDELLEQFGEGRSGYGIRNFPRESHRRHSDRFRQETKMRRRQSDGDEPFETDTTRDPFQDLPNQETNPGNPSHYGDERGRMNVLDGKLFAHHKKVRHHNEDDYSYDGAVRWKLLKELDSILDPRNSPSSEQVSKRQLSSQGTSHDKDDDVDEWRRRIVPAKVYMEMQSGENLGTGESSFPGPVREEDDRMGYRKYRRQGPLVGQGYDGVDRPIVKDPLIHQPKKRFWIERQESNNTSAPAGVSVGPMGVPPPVSINVIKLGKEETPGGVGPSPVAERQPQGPSSGHVVPLAPGGNRVGPPVGNSTGVEASTTPNDAGFSVVMPGRGYAMRGHVTGRRAAKARRLRGSRGGKKAKKLKDTEGLKILRNDEMSAEEDDDDDDDGDDDDDDEEDDDDKDAVAKKITIQSVTAKSGQVGRVDAAERPVMSLGERLRTEPTRNIEAKKDAKSAGNLVGNSESPDCVPDTLRAHTDYCRGIYTKHQMSIEEARKLPSKKSMACYKLESIKGCLSAGSYFSKCIGSNNNEFQDLQGSVMNQMRELHCGACMAYSSTLVTVLAVVAVHILGRND